MKNHASLVENRRHKILDLLEHHGRLKVSFLADELCASPLTIRRDLEFLEQHLLVERYHGGARLLNPSDSSFSSSLTLHKHAIAQAAAQFIEDHDTIFINTSSTALLVLKYCSAKQITVITNNAKAVYAERSDNTLIVLTGGELRDPKESMVGHFALQNLVRVNASKVFLGCNGISFSQGIATSIMQEAAINEMMLKRAQQRFVLADHSKVGATSNFTSGHLKEGDTLITDEDSSRKILDRFRRMGVHVLQVAPLKILD